MAPHKAIQPEVQSDDDASSGYSSSSGQIESGSETGSNHDLSESDSLDSSASRKRRRISPKQVAEPLLTSVNAPSRIKAKPANADNSFPASSTGVLAPVDSSTSFEDLNVKPWLVRSLASMAIKRPTGIQKGCIPEILKGKDCIGGSRTGSGKTIAFSVPMLQRWSEDPVGIYGLILTPTRELALQIYEQIKAISSPQSLKAILVIGGVDQREQATALGRRPHIVIATPGRLAEHIKTSGEDTICGLRRVKMVVLDEADRLLDPSGSGSMLPAVGECLSILPAPNKRQTLLFTATVTPQILALKDEPRPNRQPLFVCEVDTQVLAVPPQLKQMYLKIPVTFREHYLHMFLLTELNLPKSVIIFCNRTATADYLTHLLRLLEHRVTALHSKLPQRQRIDNLGRFRAAAARILVATDVAARGLDIPEVGIVINYDIPRDVDDYIHRVGRTARAGRKGESVTIVGQRDAALFLAIEKRTGKKMLEWKEEGVNLETRVMREALKVVGEKKREALLEIEEGREVGGKRKRGMQSFKKKGK